MLLRVDDDGRRIPLDIPQIERIVECLINDLNIPAEHVDRPGVAIRVPVWGTYFEPPEPELLNSFFIADLLRVKGAFASQEVGPALKAYLGTCEPKEHCDVVRDRQLLRNLTVPARTPASRWPSKGRHSLVLLQQAAVNHALNELASGGLIAINGPPGTGKTTLLRDMIASVVLERARVLAKYDNPKDAFSPLTTIRLGARYGHMYRLDDSLLGFEMVVGSSNNKAVENISTEIPAKDALADDFDPPLRYFSSIADAVASGEGPLQDGATWGLAAAVLGNAANRSAFVNSFWWHPERSMNLYLQACLNANLQDQVSQQCDLLRELEQPPSGEEEALARWKEARRDFSKRFRQAEQLLQQLEAARKALGELPGLKQEKKEAELALEQAVENVSKSERVFEDAQRACAEAIEEERLATEHRRSVELLRPGWLSRVFRTSRFRMWFAEFSRAVKRVLQTHDAKNAARRCVEKAKQLLEEQRVHVQEYRQACGKLGQQIETCHSMIAQGKQISGVHFADDAFWERDHQDLQVATPWLSPPLQAARDEVFAAAFRLHRAFIDAAAKPLRHNLAVALEVMKGRTLSDKQEPGRQSLWASLFLVVPVISTTFASTSRLFGQMGHEGLGWLFIDEAGQATPQAAVGAIWRAKRILIVGDPLQIEPVVTVPERLVRAIFREGNVPYEDWAPPHISAQLLADRTCRVGAKFQYDTGDLWVGFPLLVHRRCNEPMFSISNHMAYNGLMVCSTPSSVSEIGEVLGESCWIDITAPAVGKWCADEGRLALELFKFLVHRGIKSPDIYFITPFRIVRHELRQLFWSKRELLGGTGLQPWEWCEERVGTVHTFQGKEAEAVAFVLGAPSPETAGARYWAGCTPNLPNVAVSRAKCRLYVIGGYSAWRTARFFRHLATRLPVVEASEWIGRLGAIV